MEKTIENINTLLAGQYTLYNLLIEKKLITEEELIARLRDNKNLPTRKKGVKILEEMLAPSWEDQVDFKETAKELLNKATERITNLTLPPPWVAEGVEPPNSTAIRNALRICHDIFNSKGMIPDQIAPTKENGVFFKYLYGPRQLIIEAYNDGEVAAIVVDDTKKDTIHSEDIRDFNFFTCLNILTVNT